MLLGYHADNINLWVNIRVTPHKGFCLLLIFAVYFLIIVLSVECYVLCVSPLNLLNLLCVEC